MTLLPTPNAVDGNSNTRSEAALAKGERQVSLCDLPRLLPTPKASDGPNGGPGMRNGRGEADALPGVVGLLATPNAAGNTKSRRARNATSGRQEGSQHQGGTTLTDVVHVDAFGPYAPAIARWEGALGRPAPSPTEPGKDGRPRLSPRFVEWMQGLEPGHVTDPAIGLSRAQQLKVLGNGVVPQQARLALSMLGAAPTLPTLPTLPTPTVSDTNGAGAHGDGGADLRTAVSLLPTPQAHDAQGPKTPDAIATMRAKGHGVRNLNEEVLSLLPTPAVNDMGEGKTPADDWDQWTDRMRAAHGNGNGHGKSLAIEALRLADD